MNRAALRLSLVCAVSLTACTNIDLATSYVPYACDPAGGDGGKQCANGWSCGFDQKCFDRDASVNASAWLCGDAGHCPNRWTCGVAIDDAGYCVELGVGAPSQCLSGDDCQARWRCGLDRHCFDPQIPDAGTTRACSTATDAGDLQCPNGFRCGQPVGSAQFCIELDAGAPSLCTSDRGCEGGWRCDTAVNHCVEVRDTVDPGALTGFGVTVVSPLRREPAPRLTSVSRAISLVPFLVDDVLPNRRNAGIVIGDVFAAGVRIDALNLERDPKPDGGRQALVVSRALSLPGLQLASVVELVATPTHVAVRTTNDDVHVYAYGDAGATELPGLPPKATAIRAVERVSRGMTVRSVVIIDQALTFIDGDGTVQITPVDFDGGVPVARLVEFVRQPFGDYAWDENGLAWTRPLNDAGYQPWRPATTNTAPLPGGPMRSVQVVPGIDRGNFPTFTLQRPTHEVMPYVASGPQGDLATGVFAACPNDGGLLQLTSGFEPSSNRTLPVSICRAPTGETLSVTLRSQTGPGGIERVTPNQYVTDLLPFERTVVSATTAPFVRAHASVNGLKWFTLDFDAASLPAGGGNLADQPLYPLVLDRQPDTIVYVASLGGVVVTSGAHLFNPEPTLGLAASVDPPSFALLGVFENQPTWLMTTHGLIDLSTVDTGGSPTEFAVADGGNGAGLESPVTGFHLRVQVDGQDRDVALIASGDKFWAGDVTNVNQPFSSQALIAPIFVPQSGVPLRSLALVRPRVVDGGVKPGLRGFLATNTAVMEFTTEDLVRWSLDPVVAPPNSQLPLEVWAENGDGRVGTRDGVVWSLPIRVALTGALVASDGGALYADDFARHCGATFATTREGVFTLEAVDGGRPGWKAVSAVNAALDSLTGLRLYTATAPSGPTLYVATRGGQVVQVTHSGACP